MEYPLLNFGTRGRPVYVRPVHLRWVRTLAVLLFFACQFAPLSGSAAVVAAARAAQVPLPAFLLLSGLLFSDQRTGRAGRWLAVHAVRAAVPFCLCLLLLPLLAERAGGLGASLGDYLLFLNGSGRPVFPGVSTASQLGLLYTALLCLLVTPLLDRFSDAVRSLGRAQKAAALGAALAAEALACVALAAWAGPLAASFAGSLLASFSLYPILYFARPALLSLTGGLKPMALFTLAAAASFVLTRWLSALLIEVPPFLQILAGVAAIYLRAVVYLWFFALVFCIVRRFRRFPRPAAHVVAAVDSMAFELYLAAYFALNSRLRLPELTQFGWLNLLLTLLAAFAAAFCLSRAGRFAAGRLQKRLELG